MHYITEGHQSILVQTMYCPKLGHRSFMKTSQISSQLCIHIYTSHLATPILSCTSRDAHHHQPAYPVSVLPMPATQMPASPMLASVFVIVSSIVTYHKAANWVTCYVRHTMIHNGNNQALQKNCAAMWDSLTCIWNWRCMNVMEEIGRESCVCMCLICIMNIDMYV